MTTQLEQIRDEELEALHQYQKGATPPPLLYRADGSIKAVANALLQFVASEESEDRLGDVIKIDGWDTANFKRNPVMLYAHDHTFPPVGKITRLEAEGKQLVAAAEFDTEDEFARLIQSKYERGFMRAVSVGFRAIDFEMRKIENPTPLKVEGILFKKQELVEISAVPVPAHPKALRKALGTRSFFWIPFVPKEEEHPPLRQIEELQSSNGERLSNAVQDVLKHFGLQTEKED